jgi:hypothetical protein
MAASDNLSQQLFHGTDANLSAGDVIVPKGRRVAHATPDVNAAASYAEMRTEPRNATHSQLSMFGTVYKVAPVDNKEFKTTDAKERVRRTEANNPDESAASNFKFSKKGFKVTGIEKLVPNESDMAVHSIRERKKKRAAEEAEDEAKWAEARKRVGLKPKEEY